MHVAIFVALGIGASPGPERALPGAVALCWWVVCAAGAGYWYASCGTRYSGRQRSTLAPLEILRLFELRSTVTLPVRARLVNRLGWFL
jgi:hypothetical protein